MATRSALVIGPEFAGEDWARLLLDESLELDALADEAGLALDGEELLLEEELLEDELRLLEAAFSSSEKSISSLGEDSLGCAVSGSPSVSLDSSQGEPSA